jgi:hypothetical protein
LTKTEIKLDKSLLHKSSSSARTEEQDLVAKSKIVDKDKSILQYFNSVEKDHKARQRFLKSFKLKGNNVFSHLRKQYEDSHKEEIGFQ